MSGYKVVPVELKEFSEGATHPIGDCGAFVSGIDHNNTITNPYQWDHQIEVYGRTPEHAEALRDRVLVALEAPAVQGEPVAHTFYILHDAAEGQKYIKKDVDDGCLAIFEREEDAQRAERRHPATEYKRVDYCTAPQPVEQQPTISDEIPARTTFGGPQKFTVAEQQPVPSTPTFQLGDHVRKTKGSQWKGRIVGTYSTDLTPEGYAVESDTEKGSVQIYPAAALELVGSGHDSQ